MLKLNTSNSELDRPLLKEKIIKVILLMKDKLGGKIMIKFIGLRAKTSIYLTDDGSEDKKAKGTKNVIKRKLKSDNHKNCLQANHLENKRNIKQ